MNRTFPNRKVQAVALAMTFLGISAGPVTGQNFKAETHGAGGKIWEGVVRLVKAGDKIVLDPYSLKLPGSVIKVAWRQKLRTRKADYVQTVAALSSPGLNEVMSIFVEKNRVDAFLAKCGNGGKPFCTMTVGSDFQYGQSLTGAFRFLVYHDKASRPFSRRFTGKSTQASFRNIAHKLAKGLGRADLGNSIDFTAANYSKNYAGRMFGNSGSIGNSLREFDRMKAPASSIAGNELLSNEEKVALIDQKSRSCAKEAINLFRNKGAAEKHYLSKCDQWSRAAWSKMAGNPGRDVQPQEFGFIEDDWRRCMKRARTMQGHRVQGEMKCELRHKMQLLAIGADPSVHYDYSRGPVFKQFFARGTWRLKK